jgi:pimeloyl-ACP methyl ester carboxylesterase
MKAALLLLSFFVASAPGAEDPKERFPKKDHDALAKEVAKWIAAKDAKQSTAKLVEEIGKRLADAAKRAKAGDPLSCIPDLEAVLDATVSYRKTGFTTGNEIQREYEADGGEKRRYAMRVPRKYEPDKQGYPLLVSIPAPGEDPKNHLANLWKHEGLRDAAILYAPEIPKGTKEWLDLGGIDLVLSGAKDLWTQFRVDRNRVILSGQGESAVLALRLATYFPDRFAAVVLRQLPETKAVLRNLRNVPVLLVGEGAGSKAVATALNDLTYAVEEKPDDLEAVATWVLSRRRIAYPDEVVFLPARRFAKNANWVRIDEYDPGGGGDILDLPPDRQPWLKGRIDREKNEIAFETRGIYSFDVLLNDAVVDLGKEVRIVLNGQEWTGTFERNLEFLLDMVFVRNDPSTVYVASHACRVAQKSEERAPAAGEEASGSKDGKGGERGERPR